MGNTSSLKSVRGFLCGGVWASEYDRRDQSSAFGISTIKGATSGTILTVGNGIIEFQKEFLRLLNLKAMHINSEVFIISTLRCYECTEH